MEICKNIVYVSGKVVSSPLFHHENKYNTFVTFEILVPRKAGVEDIIPVIIDKEYLSSFSIGIGDNIFVKGEYRSYNDGEEVLLFLYVKELEVYDHTFYCNDVTIEGYVCKKYKPRLVPGRLKATRIILAVNREYNKSSYIPCNIWDKTHEEHEEIDDLKVGDKIKVWGSIHSREYHRSDREGLVLLKTAFEVSVKNYSKLKT